MSLDTPENRRPVTPSSTNQIPATITKTPSTVRRGRVPPTPDSIESEHDSDTITGKITKQKCFKAKSTTNNSLNIKNSIPNNNFTNQDQPSSSYSSSTSNLSSSKQLVLQQQHLGQSDRMSKEKQKFFRHSAFNSGRVLKTSPPTSRNKLNNNRSSSSSLIQNSLNTSQFQYNSSDSETKIIPKFVNLSASLKKEAEKKKSNLSDTTSSSSSSDESSSSGSCSSSDDSNESDSSSSSNSSSSSTTTTNDKAINTLNNDSKKIGFIGNIFKNNKSKLNISSNINSSFVVDNSKEDTWGFAAEAKKPSDIFSKNDIKTQQRIFGNFSGVEKDSLIKINDDCKNLSSDDDSLNKNDKTAHSGPLKGLFDSLTPFFTTNDYTRRQIPIENEKKNKDDDELPKEILKETRSTFKNYKKSLLQEKLQKEIKKTDSNKILTVNNIENKSEAKKIAENPPVIKKRIIPVSLPLDRTKMRYNSSSDDEIPYLSPSKLFKQACNSKEGTSSIFKTVDHKLFGSNDTNNLDFASLRENGNTIATATTMTTNSYGQIETVSPYNNNQSMGKKHVIKINGILFRLFFFFFSLLQRTQI